jgi:hypothetical protein
LSLRSSGYGLISIAALHSGDSGSRKSRNNDWNRNPSKHDGKRDKADVRGHGDASSMQ